jgi:hypothetical protein
MERKTGGGRKVKFKGEEDRERKRERNRVQGQVV